MNKTVIVFDLETTGTDTNTCEVAQVAVAVQPVEVTDAGMLIAAGEMEVHKTLCRVDEMPPEATAVHGITAEMTEGAQRFFAIAPNMTSRLEDPDVIVVTFNGRGYDIPVLRRHLAHDPALDHVDMYRVWQYVRTTTLTSHWQTSQHHRLPASIFSGSLSAMHAFYTGEVFDGAHDAGNDCIATLRPLLECGIPLHELRRITNSPLPNDVDMDGKLKWRGTTATIGFGKHKDTAIEDVPRDYLMWMINKGDFPRGTCDVIRNFLNGTYPVKR